MKRNINIMVFFALLPAFVLLLLTVGCKKTSDPTGPEPQSGELWLKGRVIHSETHAAIVNAQVYITGQPVLSTDANGFYQINGKTVGSGIFEVRVTAEGFGYGSAYATIAYNTAMVNTIMLKPLAAPVPIGPSGGTITAPDPESLTPGSNTTLVIPVGTFAQEFLVTMTRFTGIDVPGYAPAGNLNLCTVNLGPAGTVAGKAVELNLPLPFLDQAVDNLLLLRYDITADAWVNTGTYAQVDHLSNMATVEITEFGTYSLAITGTFSEMYGNSGAAVTLQLDPTKASIDFNYLARNEYPGGIPATLSLAYLKNIASQNTNLNGARVSFTDSTSVTYNYIGFKSDSLALSTSGYYRWAPKVSYATQEMPMSATITGMTVNGIIVKEVYSDASTWDYVHDQGSGGK